MNRIRQFLRRHTVWLGAAAVFLPLLLLLRLQYGWLVSLEKASAIAHQATLDNYLETLATEFEYWFKGNAERVLNLPSAHFVQDTLEKSAYFFRKKGVEGARWIFVVNYARQDQENEDLYVFDAARWETTPSREEIKAILVALAPWKLMAQKEVRIGTVALSVDERDPDNRIILNPITDNNSRVVGVAGIILDNDFFRETLLPKMIAKTLSQLFGEEASRSLAVMAWDDSGTAVYGTDAPGSSIKGYESKRGFDFVYTDWSLGLRRTDLTPEQWARSNLALNLTLSALLAVVLIGGMVLALRTVSREMKLSQMKADFVSNVSHELRTPLSSIRVFGEFLRLGRVQDEEKIREYGEYIETESRRLTQLINNILDFSKIESGGKTYRFQEGDVHQVVTETLRTFQVRLEHSGFRIDLQMPDELLPTLRMDRQALTQAVANLLDNAVKYSRDSKEIRVRLHRAGEWVTIAVQDRGMGISRDEQQKIFERFHRVSTGLVHDVKGSGLGLAIVSHIVQAHGGKVTVDSEPGKGSTFTIHLPLVHAREPSPASEAELPGDSPAAPATEI